MPTATRRRDAATKTTTRCIMNVLSEDNNSGTECGPSMTAPGDWDTNRLNLALLDLQESLDNRLAILKSQTAKAKDAQKQCWVNASVKIRKSIKEMTVRDFNAQYKSDLLKLLREPLLALSSKNSNQKRRGLWNATSTPAPSSKAPNAMNTAARTAKRGEAIFSENGSPVDALQEGALVATVTKKRRIRSGDVPVQFDINIGDGQYISLNNPGNLELLDEGLKSNAIQQLQVLQDQMASLMAQLKS